MTPREAVPAFHERVWNRVDKRRSLSHAARLHIPRAPHDGTGEGDRAFARICFEGIHRGPFIAATGRRVERAGAALFTLEGGKIADLWVLGDANRLLEQLQRNAEH